MDTDEFITLVITDMANGGAALGRDEGRRVIFVPYTIPGERVQVNIVEDRGRFAQGRLRVVLDASPERVEPRCAHFGVCGGCAFQHIRYEAQLVYKRDVVQDQLERIGKLQNVPVRPVLPHPDPWQYSTNVTFGLSPAGGLGFWSPFEQKIIPIQECHIIRPELLELSQDVDLDLPALRSMTLRQGDDGALLIALAVDGVEPPQLDADFPVSVAIVLPDGRAANLVGDNYVVKTVHGHDLRVSAGCFFYPSPPVIDMLVDQVLQLANLTGREIVLEAYAGVGTLTTFLAGRSAAVHAIEVNPDAVADAALNLVETENVSFYEGLVEEVLPLLDIWPDVIVVDPPLTGLPKVVLEKMVAMQPQRLIYVSSDVATQARDSKQLAQSGYRPVLVQPLDMYPQTQQIQSVILWEKS